MAAHIPSEKNYFGYLHTGGFSPSFNGLWKNPTIISLIPLRVWSTHTDCPTFWIILADGVCS